MTDQTLNSSQDNRTLKYSDDLPAKIGPYEILQLIGKGGFGQVYKARAIGDVKVNGRIVVMSGEIIAIKVLTTLSKDAKDRFILEGEISKNLPDHKHIIKIKDEGKDDKDHPYMVMDYIEGGSLAGLIKKGRLNRNEAIRIIKCVAEALDCAHSYKYQDETGRDIKWIIHRDIKPDNILLDNRYNPANPLLTDFGIAKLIEANISTMEQTGTLIGTPLYMAPEQFEGKAVTPATDLYELAFVLFEMLTGKDIFALTLPSDETGSPFLRLADFHRNRIPPNLSEILPEMGLHFDSFFRKAMSKNPTERYQNAAEFINALQEANAKAEEAERIWNDTLPQIRKILKPALSLVEIELDNSDDNEIRTKLLNLNVSTIKEIDKAAILERLNEVTNRYSEYKTVQIYEIAQVFKHIVLGEEEELLEKLRQDWLKSGAPSAYVKKLAELAGKYWNDNPSKAIGYYERIYDALDRNLVYPEQIQTIRQYARSQLIEYYYQQGLEAYAGGKPENMDKVIEVLEKACAWLNKLDASDEYKKTLNGYYKRLQVRKIQDQIAKVKDERIDFKQRVDKDLGLSDDNSKLEEKYLNTFKNEIVSYEQLLEIDPYFIDDMHEPWEKLAKAYLLLVRRAEKRAELAEALNQRIEQDQAYRTAINYLQELLKIKRHDFKDLRLSQLDDELNTEEKIEKKIRWLEGEADYAKKYAEIDQLVKEQKYQEVGAIFEAFGFDKVNQYRDIAKLFWIVTYALDHNNQLPPELTSVEELKAKLAETQQELSNTRQEKETLKEELTQTRTDLDKAKLSLQQKQQKIAQLEIDLNTKTQTLQTQLAQIEQREREQIAELQGGLEINKQRTNKIVALRQKDAVIISAITLIGVVALIAIDSLGYDQTIVVGSTALTFLVLIVVALWRYLRS